MWGKKPSTFYLLFTNSTSHHRLGGGNTVTHLIRLQTLTAVTVSKRKKCLLGNRWLIWGQGKWRKFIFVLHRSVAVPAKAAVMRASRDAFSLGGIAGPFLNRFDILRGLLNSMQRCISGTFLQASPTKLQLQFCV